MTRHHPLSIRIELIRADVIALSRYPETPLQVLPLITRLATAQTQAETLERENTELRADVALMAADLQALRLRRCAAVPDFVSVGE